MGIKIAQINDQRSTATTAELQKIMIDDNRDVMCIQEPYAYKGQVRGYTAPQLAKVQPNTEKV